MTGDFFPFEKVGIKKKGIKKTNVFLRAGDYEGLFLQGNIFS